MGENNTSNKTFNLFKDSLTYAFSKALPGITGLLSVILFFRLVGPAEYGRFSLLFTFANMCAAFSFGWLNQSILRYYSTFQEKQTFSSIVKKDKVIAFQFHPEKSGNSGLILLKSLVKNLLQ